MGVDAVVVPNALDERLWAEPPVLRTVRHGPVRLLFMGTATHDADFALVEPALARLHQAFPGRITFDLIGVTTRRDLPEWVNRVPLAISGNLSYPGFIDWMSQLPAWDIGIAPLVDSPFNHGKSGIKAIDYAALGLAVAASDVAAYRDTLRDGATGLLVANTEAAWFDALSWLVRDPALRLWLAQRARAAFAERWTLAAQAEQRQEAWQAVLQSVRRAKTPEVHRGNGKLTNGRAGGRNIPTLLGGSSAPLRRGRSLRSAQGRGQAGAALAP
jgi:glycosyltransferase involved in cell wall biosynthesis